MNHRFGNYCRSVGLTPGESRLQSQGCSLKGPSGESRDCRLPNLHCPADTQAVLLGGLFQSGPGWARSDYRRWLHAKASKLLCIEFLLCAFYIPYSNLVKLLLPYFNSWGNQSWVELTCSKLYTWGVRAQVYTYCILSHCKSILLPSLLCSPFRMEVTPKGEKATFLLLFSTVPQPSSQGSAPMPSQYLSSSLALLIICLIQWVVGPRNQLLIYQEEDVCNASAPLSPFVLHLVSFNFVSV